MPLEPEAAGAGRSRRHDAPRSGPPSDAPRPPRATARPGCAPRRLPDPRPGGPRPPAGLPRLGRDVARSRSPVLDGDRRLLPPVQRQRPSRASTQLGEQATAAYEGAREQVARFINAPDPHEIVFARNATEAINLVAYFVGPPEHRPRRRRSCSRSWSTTPTSCPWQLLVQEKDADLEFVPIIDDGPSCARTSSRCCSGSSPKLVAFTHVSNTLGTINPVARDDRARRTRPARSSSSTARRPCRTCRSTSQAIGADFYVFTGHKTLAPTGSGVLWAPPRAARGDAAVHGRRRDDPRGPSPPLRLERRALEVRGRHAGHRAPRSVSAPPPSTCSALGMDRVREHERELVAYALDLLPREVPGIALYGPARPTSAAASSRSTCRASTPTTCAQVLDRVGDRHPGRPPLHDAAPRAPRPRRDRAGQLQRLHHHARTSTRWPLASGRCSASSTRPDSARGRCDG